MVREVVFSLLSFLPPTLVFVVDVDKEEEVIFEILLVLLVLLLLMLEVDEADVIEEELEEEEHEEDEEADEGLHIVDKGGDNGG